MDNGSVRPYRRRLIDTELDELLPHLPAIAIDGARGVGKTTTARHRSAAVLYLDRGVQADVIRAEPSLLEQMPRPVLIDEWQQVPETWDVVRRAVDDGAPGGSFLLTGSATPAIGATAHSGAGRIVRLQMRPLSLVERGAIAPTVSLGSLLAGTRELAGVSQMSLRGYVDNITSSGFPAIRDLPPRARRAQLDGYLVDIQTKDLPEQGALVRRPATLRAWLDAYAAATSTTTSYNEIVRAASPGDADPPAKSTAIRYRDWLTSLWLLDPVPAWTGLSSRPLPALSQAPKHHLVDPALAARLLNQSAESLLDGRGRTLARSGPLVGMLFESLATLCVRVMAQAVEARIGHLRTRRGDHEVDLVVEGHDGALLAIEVKLSGSIRDDDVRHLHWLQERLGGRLTDALVVTTGPEAYRRKDGIGVVPLALLGP